MKPIRLQIVCFGILVAEVILEQDMVQPTWSAYVQACQDKGRPAGGSMAYTADQPRYWDVPVGSPLFDDDSVTIH